MITVEAKRLGTRVIATVKVGISTGRYTYTVQFADQGSEAANEVEAQRELRLHADPSISIVTWMEVMVGAQAEVAIATREFLGGFRLIGLGERIAALAVELRQRHKIKLPDAVIWATAQEGSMLLVTRNTKDFPADDPGVRVPYTL